MPDAVRNAVASTTIGHALLSTFLYFGSRHVGKIAVSTATGLALGGGAIILTIGSASMPVLDGIAIAKLVNQRDVLEKRLDDPAQKFSERSLRAIALEKNKNRM
jgi:hypothetical protein